MADERIEKLKEATTVLDKSMERVHTSRDDASIVVDKRFNIYREQLKDREKQFVDDLTRHQRGEIHKINKEKVIVEKLLLTLDNLIKEASDVMRGPKLDDDPNTNSDIHGYKTLAEIKDEFTSLRQVLLPWDVGYLFDIMTAKASEQMIDIRTTAVHDIINALIDTLTAARGKASATLDTLCNFISEVERVVPETQNRIRSEFTQFTDIVTVKEDLFRDKIEHYDLMYSGRINVEKQFVLEQIDTLQEAQQSARESIEYGNDYYLLKQLETLNQTLVQVDSSTLTLFFDNIVFRPCTNALTRSLDRLGVLTREELSIDPKFANAHHYYQFLEHEEYMYGGSETGIGERSVGGISDKERTLFETTFRTIDKYGDRTLNEEQLSILWSEIFSTIPKDSCLSITKRIFDEVNIAGKQRIHFDELLAYISEGMNTNLGAQRDQFYMSKESQ